MIEARQAVHNVNGIAVSIVFENVAYFVTSKCRFGFVYRGVILMPRTATFSSIFGPDFT